jgi:hypothetical protein
VGSLAAAAQLITASLATFRLTRLAIDDQITAPLREAVWRHSPPEDNGLGFVFTCPHCASIYAALAAAVLIQVAESPNLPRPIRTIASITTTALALSGTVSLLHDYGPPANS